MGWTILSYLIRAGYVCLVLFVIILVISLMRSSAKK